MTIYNRITDRGRIKQGRGLGDGSDYRPFIQTPDYSSFGRRSRIFSPFDHNIAHTMSNPEKYFFWELVWRDDIKTIQSQYPLPVEKTLEIAQRHDLQHPWDQKSNEPRFLTIDFLALTTIEQTHEILVGYDVESEASLAQTSTIHQLEIKRRCLAELGMKQEIVTDHETSEELAFNVEWVSYGRELDDVPGLDLNVVRQLEPVLYSLVSTSSTPLSYLALSLDGRCGLAEGTCLAMVRFLIWHRIWQIDIYHKLKPESDPLEILARRPELIGGADGNS
jgi:hypothetical protein